jgi:hypothetical protein
MRIEGQRSYRMKTYAPPKESPFDEVEEQELAAELLGANNEEELEQFLGVLLSRAARAARGQLRPPAMRALGGLLKGAVHQILPGAGGRFGNLLDSAVTGQLAAGAPALLGLEAEGLSAEDREFTAARQLIRLGGTAAVQAAVGPSAGAPQVDAQQAMIRAVRVHAPGLMRSAAKQEHACGCGGSGSCSCHHRTGSWERRGRRIILHGV